MTFGTHTVRNVNRAAVGALRLTKCTASRNQRSRRSPAARTYRRTTYRDAITRRARELRRALRRRAHAQPLKLAPGENRNVFVMKTETARRLAVEKISDLAKYWPASG